MQTRYDWAALRARIDRYEKLMRLDKPIGILLLLWPTLWAVWLSGRGEPSWLVAWIFTLGTVLMRSAGCVINDYADRKFDPHVERTKQREQVMKAFQEVLPEGSEARKLFETTIEAAKVLPHAG